MAFGLENGASGIWTGRLLPNWTPAKVMLSATSLGMESGTFERQRSGIFSFSSAIWPAHSRYNAYDFPPPDAREGQHWGVGRGIAGESYRSSRTKLAPQPTNSALVNASWARPTSYPRPLSGKVCGIWLPVHAACYNPFRT